MKKVGMLMIAVFLIKLLNAQEEKKFEPTFGWSGFTHVWSSYGMTENTDEYYGFSVRYLRLKASGKLLPDVKWMAQLGMDKGNPGIVDVLVAYEPMDYLNIQFGQFAVPGVKSGSKTCNLWSTTKQVFNDRPTITQNWGSNAGLSSYRSLGAMLYGGFADKMVNYYIMLATSKSGADNYFNASVKSPEYSHNENGMAVFSRLEIKPMEELAIGGSFHTGMGASFDTIDVKRNSYSVYTLYNKSGIRLMAEYVAGSNEEKVYDTITKDFDYNGYYIEASYKILKKYEPALRIDGYTPAKNNSDKYGVKSYMNYTIGFNYYPSNNIALMINYVIRKEETETGIKDFDNDLIYLQMRYKFKSN